MARAFVPSHHGRVGREVRLHGKTLADPPGYEVQLFYASHGQEQSLVNNTPPYNFTNVPMGLHAIQVVKTTQPGAGTVMSQDTVVVRPGSTVSVELWF